MWLTTGRRPGSNTAKSKGFLIRCLVHTNCRAHLASFRDGTGRFFLMLKGDRWPHVILRSRIHRGSGSPSWRVAQGALYCKMTRCKIYPNERSAIRCENQDLRHFVWNYEELPPHWKAYIYRKCHNFTVIVEEFHCHESCALFYPNTEGNYWGP